jgi:NADP-dependent 3-hydroxy acid dehydrogenase YdfG
MKGSVLITGASSGLGLAMAQEFARRGYHLALAARRIDALEQLQAQLSQDFPRQTFICKALDVCDWPSVAPVIKHCAEALGGLDIVIANAGIATGHAVGSGHLADDVQVIQTNVVGAMATIDAALALFRTQNRGQLVAISSVAAKRGMPGFGAYGASKAALATYMEAVNAEVFGTQIKTTTLFPGYIDTPLNNHIRNRPFVIDVERGARALVDLIEQQVTESTVPVYPWNLISVALKWAPRSVIAKQHRPKS